MRQINTRIPDRIYAQLRKELVEWKAVRGPRFSLNDLCKEKLGREAAPTLWPSTSEVIRKEVPDAGPVRTESMGAEAGGHAEPAAISSAARTSVTVTSSQSGMPPPPRFEPEPALADDDDLLSEQPNKESI
jgi:hypothetical protein